MSSDLRTEINDCDAITGWTGDGPISVDSTAGFVYEGTNAISTQHTNTDEHLYTTQNSAAGTTFSLDWSDATLYLIVKDNLLQTAANGGAQFVIGDGTDRVGFGVGGNDDPGMPLDVFWNTYKLDVSERANAPYNNVYAGVLANLTVTAITQVGYGSVHLAKAQGNVDNIKLDSIKYVANGSYALRINGGTSGTPETMADVEGDSVTNGWGMVANPVGQQYTFFAPTEWGEPTANADVYFAATDEQWYWLGGIVGATHFPFRVVGNATDTISWVVTRVTIVNVGTDAEFDMSSADVNILQLDACVFTDLGAIDFPAQSASNKYAIDCIFNNCGLVTLNTLDMDGCVFNGSKNANGAVIWDAATTGPANQDNFTFNSDGTGHAIHVRPTGAGPHTYNITGYTFDGYAGQSGTDTNRVFYIDPVTSSADITINLTDSTALNVVGGGSGFSYRTAAGYTGTVTIQTTVTLSVQVNDADGNGISGARVRIEETDGTLVADGTTNGTGLFTTSYNFGGDLSVRIKSRLKGYKPFRTTGTITSSGLSAVAPMQTDRIVDLP